GHGRGAGGLCRGPLLAAAFKAVVASAPALASRRRWDLMGWRLTASAFRAARQAHCKDRALARLARHRHVAAHRARELAREGKAKPRAAEALGSRGIGLVELLEELGLLLGGHANAGVSDRELDPVATVGDPARPQPDLAFLGELAGIAEEIEQDLPQPHWIDGQCAEVLLGVNDEAVLVLLGKLSGRADDLIDQRCELHGFWIEFEFSGLDLPEVEHLVDEAKEGSPGPLPALHAPP